MHSVCIVVILLNVYVSVTNCRDFIPDKLCATLYSEKHHEGEAFYIRDFEHIVSTKRDYRQSLKGWNQTQSQKVEEGCILTLNSKAYFQGVNERVENLQNNMSTTTLVESAKCTCQRKCSCDDIFLPQDRDPEGIAGRAYINSSCNICNSEYVLLYKSLNEMNENYYYLKSDVPEAGLLVVDIIVFSGCKLTMVLGDRTKITLHEQFTPEFQKYVYAYNMVCDPMPSNITVPKHDSWLEKVEHKHDLIKILTFNYTLFMQPGAQAVVKSVENGRSHRNAYVIIIGSLPWTDILFEECVLVEKETIWECHIPVSVNDFKVETQVRAITVPMEDNEAANDASLAASFDKYLSQHDELKDTIPNAVIIYHNVNEKTLSTLKGNTDFERKLKLVENLGHYLLDRSYSNTIFYFGHHAESTESLEESISTLENEISATFPIFPKPFHFIGYNYVYHGNRIHCNGYHFAAPEGSTNYVEYSPMAEEMAFKSICSKGGDPFGEAIFKAYYVQSSRIPISSIDPIEPKTSVDKRLVIKYTESIFNVNPRNQSGLSEEI